MIAGHVVALEWTATAILTALHLGPKNFNFFDLIVHHLRIQWIIVL
jgi:hypothetical protein